MPGQWQMIRTRLVTVNITQPMDVGMLESLAASLVETCGRQAVLTFYHGGAVTEADLGIMAPELGAYVPFGPKGDGNP